MSLNGYSHIFIKIINVVVIFLESEQWDKSIGLLHFNYYY